MLHGPPMTFLIPHAINSPKQLRLLVVDDNPANSALMAEYFKPFNLQVDEAVSGFQALERVAMYAYDLIFMDVNMPGLNGPDTTARLRQRMPRQARIPIVALTAHAVEQHKMALLTAGMDDYLGKPAAFNDLVALLEKWLGAPALAAAGIKAEHSAIPPAPMDSAKVLPVVRIDECLRMARNNPALALDLMQQFLTHLPQAVTGLENAYTSQDWPALKDQAHRFYGGCCYVGVPAVQAATLSLNKALQPPYGGVDSAFQQWKAAVAALITWEQEHDLSTLFDVL